MGCGREFSTGVKCKNNPDHCEVCRDFAHYKPAFEQSPETSEADVRLNDLLECIWFHENEIVELTRFMGDFNPSVSAYQDSMIVNIGLKIERHIKYAELLKKVSL
jgi:hypothetical protein